jgi:hypothetical protein
VQIRESERVGLADEVGLDAGGRRDQGRRRPTGRHYAAVARAGHVGVGGHEARPGQHVAHGLGQLLVADRGGLAHHNIVRIVVGERVAHLVQGPGEPTSPSTKALPPGFWRARKRAVAIAEV